MRNALTPITAVSGSEVKMPINCGASSEETYRDQREEAHVVEAGQPHRALGALGLPAPRFWPTSVAAALLMPHAGSSANIRMRIAIV
jgi:hypothetical protein